MMYYGPYSDNLSTFTLLKQIAQIPQNLLLARVNTLRYTRITGFAQLSRIFNFYLAGLLHRP